MTGKIGVSRRVWLGGALTASLWAGRSARAEAPSPSAEGVRQFVAAPSAAALTAPPAPATRLLLYNGA
ncbi:MAG: hypothetical protein JO107_15550, partial [Hyphomicrobiales bacterium]|nr:hypothetical protein [Hyphomicrobiales bacterium]